MIPGIVAAAPAGEPTPPDIDPHWADVLLLIDASRKSSATDPHWADVLLLIDESKP